MGCRRCHIKFFFSSMQIPEEGKGLGRDGRYLRAVYRKEEEREEEGGVVRFERDNQMPDEVMLGSVTAPLQLVC